MLQIETKIKQLLAAKAIRNFKTHSADLTTFTTRNSWIFMVETTKFQSQNREFFQENKLEKFIGFAQFYLGREYSAPITATTSSKGTLCDSRQSLYVKKLSEKISYCRF